MDGKTLLPLVRSTTKGIPVTTTEPATTSTSPATHHRSRVAGFEIFWREAGPKDAPGIVLLPGHPSSSLVEELDIVATQVDRFLERVYS
jgi:hypothetical protein